MRAIAKQSRGNKIEIAASLALLVMTANNDAVTSGGISRYGDTNMEADGAQEYEDNEGGRYNAAYGAIGSAIGGVAAEKGA